MSDDDTSDGHCHACALANGEAELPGGRIHETDSWLVEHCIGPLGLGALIVKPKRHVTAVGELTPGESIELGPLLQQASAVAAKLAPAEQVYNCLWSHAGGVPVHIHYVIQPITAEQMAEHDARGPVLQSAMFVAGEVPPPDQVEAAADTARRLFSEMR